MDLRHAVRRLDEAVAEIKQRLAQQPTQAQFIEMNAKLDFIIETLQAQEADSELATEAKTKRR